LMRHQPKTSIEIGTYKGGSLSLLSQMSKTVFSIDIDPSIPERFGFFENVSFITAASGDALPLLFEVLDSQGLGVDFILIDGDHSAAGVRRDIDIVLQFTPKVPLFVMVHDAFNPECRRGMKEASWSESRHLRWLDLDFVPGRLVEHGGGGHGELWGGLACAYFEPAVGASGVAVGESARNMQAWLSRFSEAHA